MAEKSDRCISEPLWKRVDRKLEGDYHNIDRVDGRPGPF